ASRSRPLKESGSVHDDAKFNEFLKRNAAGYRAEAQAPADELWGRIERDVAEAIAPSHARRFGRRFWITTGAAVAAALILGVGIGRWSASLRAPVARRSVRMAAREDSLRLAAHVRAPTLDHLSETEMFLTEVRADLRT